MLFRSIGFLSVEGGKIYFTASVDGNDQLFMFSLNDNKLFQVTGSATGNYFVNASGNKLVYSNFTADGYQLKEIVIDNSSLKEADNSLLNKAANHYEVANENNFSNLRIDQLAARNFSVDKYRKGTRLLNFHSWRPYYEDPEFTYTIYGENVLNTLQTELYYLYNQDDRTNAVGLSSVYGAWFPYLSAGTEYTFKRTDVLNNVTRQWNQLDTRVGLSRSEERRVGKECRL